jgi:hypothetical protein
LFTSSTEEYSALRADLQELKDRPGILKFVLDTLIDLDVIADEPPAQKERSDIERVDNPPSTPEAEKGGGIKEEYRPASG